MPGKAKIKFDKELFGLKLELRRKVEDLCGVLPFSATYDEFYKYFVLCYEDWVEYFYSFKGFYDKKDKHLASIKNKTRYKCPSLKVLLSFQHQKRVSSISKQPKRMEETSY